MLIEGPPLQAAGSALRGMCETHSLIKNVPSTVFCTVPGAVPLSLRVRLVLRAVPAVALEPRPVIALDVWVRPRRRPQAPNRAEPVPD